MIDSCWLPKLELFEDYDNEWNKYQDAVYTIFENDFIKNHPTFNNLSVKIRWAPVEYDRPEAFFHVTCKDYKKDGDRVPDFRRCERIRWVKSFIQNYKCDSSLCDGCDGIKVWNEPYQNKMRVHILLEEERYIVVIEPRRDYCLLITAFYFEHDHTLEKKLKHYQEYKDK